MRCVTEATHPASELPGSSPAKWGRALPPPGVAETGERRCRRESARRASSRAGPLAKALPAAGPTRTKAAGGGGQGAAASSGPTGGEKIRREPGQPDPPRVCVR